MKLNPIRYLICCCCGNEAIGRQWYNRDMGFGLCTDCVPFCQRGTSAEDMSSNYGIRGIHYDIGHKFELDEIPEKYVSLLENEIHIALEKTFDPEHLGKGLPKAFQLRRAGEELTLYFQRKLLACGVNWRELADEIASQHFGGRINALHAVASGTATIKP